MKVSTKKLFANHSMFIVAVALLLVAVLFGIICLQRPTVAQAAAGREYISEVRVVQNQSGSELDAESKALQAEGYKIDLATNLLEGYTGSTYLAYKTTTDPSLAITDISLMNMNGPYSFTDYEDLIEDAKLLAEERINLMISGITEFRKNHGKTEPAKYAYKMMNKYREDDSNMFMGDFLLTTPIDKNDLKVTSKALRDMAMQANGTILSVIEKCLAIAGTPDEGETSWLDKLSGLTTRQIDIAKGDIDNDKKATMLYDSIIPIAVRLQTYHDFYQEVINEFSAESQEQMEELQKDPIYKAKFNDLVNSYFPKDGSCDYESTTLLYFQLSTFAYEKDTSLDFSGLESLVAKDVRNGSVLDLILSVLDEEIFEFDILYPMASVLSQAQVDMIYLTGFETAVMIAAGGKSIWDKTNQQLNDESLGETINTDKIPVISVYDGVDKTLYTPDGIALSNEAARRQFIDTTDTWYANNLDENAEWIFRGVLAVTGAAFIGSAVFLGVKMSKRIFQTSMIYNEVGGSLSFLDDSIGSLDDSFNSVRGAAVQGKPMWSQGIDKTAKVSRDVGFFKSKKWAINGVGGTVAMRVFLVCMFVFTVVLTVYMIMELLAYNKAPVYTQKPRIIFHNFLDKKGKSVYVRYDAVVDQKGEICDIRNKTATEWVVLYVSRDKSVGHPILANSIKMVDVSTSTAGSGYLPVKRISDTVAYSLQSKGTNKLYYKADPDAFPRTGSTFSAGSFTLALCGGILGGAALGFLATWFIMKRKSKPTDIVVKSTIN